MESYYDLLGVSEEASTDEIKAAYREHLKETHPDVSDDEDASDRTRCLIEAKEVLVDEDERRRYDRLGHEQSVGATDGQTGNTDRRTGGTDGDDTGHVWGAGDGPGEPGDAERSRQNGRSADSGGEGEKDTTGPEDRTTTSGDPGTGTGWSEASRAAWGTTEEDYDRGTTTDSREQRAPRDSWSDSGRRRDGNPTATGATGSDDDWRAWNTGGAFSVRNDAGISGRGPLPTGQSLVTLCLTFLFYPLLLVAALFPGFPLFVNVVVGGCLLLVVAYLQSQPTIGIVVFGTWALLVPVIFTGPGLSLFTLYGLVAVAGTVLPLGLSLLTRAVFRI